MAVHLLKERERALSLWVQDRLHERPAVEWATRALKQIHGELGNELMTLFAFLDEYAQKHVGLDPKVQHVWRLFDVVARESGGGHGGFQAYEIKQQLQHGKVQPKSADKLIELVRPRLTAEEPSSWARKEEERQDDPVKWVAWNFKARAGSLDSFEARFGQSELQRFSKDVLVRLLERGTAALADAIGLAREVGWLNQEVDLPNLYVHQVVAAAGALGDTDADDDERDPDAYDEHFAPLTRLLSGAFQRLANLDLSVASDICNRWDQQQGGLFLRLAAFARWNEQLRPAVDVGAYLEKLSESAFWRWTSYPEIATLRSGRWKDLSKNSRIRIEGRLVRGPSAEAFSDSADLELTTAFHRDHEVARVVDNGGSVGEQARHLVEARRLVDQRFPRHVPTVERGREGVRVTRVPDGDASKFDGELPESLLKKLQQAGGSRHFGEGDDAQAFGRTLAGKMRIIEALEKAEPADEGVENGWQLLLSYPPQKADDAAAVRALAERITTLALRQSVSRVSRLVDRLSYWLDQADEVAPGFQGAEQLWARLLPFAITLANQPEEKPGEMANDKVTDLSGEALNAPLGHLISMFLRRCPTMPARGVRPSLPAQFTEPLKALTGRARELMANRLAVHMRYFDLADRPWLEAIVLQPMMAETPEADRLWEAFAKYGQIPSPEIWTTLEPFVFRHLTSARLSRDASGRLTEMVVVVWSWSKDAEPHYAVSATAFRSTLRLAPGDVRNQAAWQFQILVRGSKTKEEDGSAADAWARFGKAFFAEVWPLEPALQSSKTSNHLAGVPGQLSSEHFVEAVETILPFLRPFDVWSLSTEFWLGKEEAEIVKIVAAHPEATLRLLAACLSPTQQHRVLELKLVLDRIVASLPRLQSDARVRALRQLAPQ